MRWSVLICAAVATASSAFQQPVSCGRHLRVVTASSSLPLLYSTTAPTSNGAQTSETGSKQVSARLVAARALMPSKGSQLSFVVDRLESSAAFNNLSPIDRNFCLNLVATTDRRLGQIDNMLHQCMDKSPRRKKPTRSDLFLQAVMRIGAAQLLFLSIPPHAAVQESVALLRMDSKLKVPEAKIKFVNAILRRISRESEQLLAKTSVIDNAADWLVENLTSAYGAEVTTEIIESAMKQKMHCLSVRQNPDATTEERQARVDEIANLFPDSAQVLPQGSIRILQPQAGSMFNWPAYQDGSWWVQDPSATLPAQILHSKLQKHASTNDSSITKLHVADMCAAPGGKTAQLCNYNFASVTAIEFSAKRAQTLRQNIHRLRMECNVEIADGRQWKPSYVVSGILLDAPCSSTGTASKKPDVLRRDRSSIDSLLETQYELLQHASTVLPSGGIITYATCSILKEESEHQIEKFLASKEGSNMKVLPIESSEVPGFESSIDSQGFIRVLPGLTTEVGDCDGFFVACLQKIE